MDPALGESATFQLGIAEFTERYYSEILGMTSIHTAKAQTWRDRTSILARPHFDRCLAAHAMANGADVCMHTKMASLSYTAGRWRLALAAARG
jgi:flavin-dependent dehydrogenase